MRTMDSASPHSPSSYARKTGSDWSDSVRDLSDERHKARSLFVLSLFPRSFAIFSASPFHKRPDEILLFLFSFFPPFFFFFFYFFFFLFALYANVTLTAYLFFPSSHTKSTSILRILHRRFIHRNNGYP